MISKEKGEKVAEVERIRSTGDDVKENFKVILEFEAETFRSSMELIENIFQDLFGEPASFTFERRNGVTSIKTKRRVITKK
jgi:hypothetical protein